MTAHLARPVAPRSLLHAVDDLLNGTDAAASKVFRPEVQAEVATRLGTTRTRMFVEVLLEQCRIALELIETAALDDDALDRKAHDLASTSGMLGYEEVWHRCRDLLVAPDPFMRKRAVRPIQDALTRAITEIEHQLLTKESAAA